MAAITISTSESWHGRVAASALSAAKLRLLQAFDDRRRIVESIAAEKQCSSRLETPAVLITISGNERLSGSAME
jgi:hypothetical protein